MNQEIAGWVTFGVAAVGVLLLAALVGWRVRRGLTPWTGLDAVLALVAMLWVSGAATLPLFRLASGEWFVSDPPLLPALAGTSAGGAAAATIVLLRARLPALGLGRIPWGWSVGAAVLVAPFLVLSAGWVVALEALDVSVDEQQLLTLIREGDDRAATILAITYGGLVAPIVEELVFRGFLIPPLQRRVGAWPAILLSGGLFGALHGGDPAAVVPLTFLGLALGWLRVRSDSLWPPLVLHLANNGFAMVLVLSGWT